VRPGVGDDRTAERTLARQKRGQADPIHPHRSLVGEEDREPGIEGHPEQDTFAASLGESYLPHRIHVAEKEVPSEFIPHAQRRFEVHRISRAEVTERGAAKRLRGEVHRRPPVSGLDHGQADPVHGEARPRNEGEVLDVEGEAVRGPLHHPADGTDDAGEHVWRECTSAVRFSTRHVEGRRGPRYSWEVMRVSFVVWAVLLAAVFSVVSFAEPVEVVRRVEEGTEVVQVTTSLLRYTFAAAGGTLRSAFIHLTGLQMTALEVVPGWEGGARRTLTFGVSLPFEVWIGEGASDARIYDATVVSPEPDQAVVRLTHSEDGLRVAKEFAVQGDALYTMDVAVQVQAPGQRIRLVLGHRPIGQAAPRLLFLYDGKTHSAPLAPGSFARFQGLGLVENARVYFLRLDEGNAVPFLAVNAAGHPVFGLEGTGEIALRGVLYTGRNRYVLLEKAGLAAVDPVGFYSQFLVVVIKFFAWLYHLTGNYGWAIILFTLITRVVTYPLMRNQFRSMARMQRLAPKLKKLQEKYKDDRQTLQQQMMELYRQEKVNPLGGCLPLLLQMPVMVLLWQAIVFSAEMISISPGFLWLRDLSQPDPYYIMVLLGTGAQILQQWLDQRRRPEVVAGGMQVMGLVFPIVMAVFFMGWPAGLWFYWFLMSAFQIGQQFIFDREMGRETARAPILPPDEPPSA